MPQCAVTRHLMPPRRQAAGASHAPPRHKPTAKNQAKAKGKGKAKAKAAARQATPAPEAQPTSQASQQAGRVWRLGEEAIASPRRTQLARRDTDAQVNRAIDSHLHGIVSKAAIAAKRGKDTGLSMRDYIALEIRSRRKHGNNLGPKFWRDLHSEFELCVGLLDDLPEPEDDDDPPDVELLTVLAGAHHVNQVRANSGVLALEMYMQHCGPLSKRDTYGLLQATQPQPTMPHHSAMRAQVAVLHWWGRMPRHQTIESKASKTNNTL